jgi:hypothetical protein
MLPKRYILAQLAEFIQMYLHNMFQVHTMMWIAMLKKLPHGNWVKAVVKVVQLCSQLDMGSISTLASN